MFQMTPAEDPRLQNLKNIATEGNNRGEPFEHGMLTVVERIENHGGFTPDWIAGGLQLFKTHEETGDELLSAEETKDVRQFIAERGWTLNQAVEYADGVDFAQRALTLYRHRLDGI